LRRGIESHGQSPVEGFPQVRQTGKAVELLLFTSVDGDLSGKRRKAKTPGLTCQSPAFPTANNSQNFQQDFNLLSRFSIRQSLSSAIE
jgi:hypothetical protein